MGERQRRQWEALGRTDPYWAVLTEPEGKNGRWDTAAFFASGAAEIRSLLDRLTAMGLAPGRRVALDYGCGVGRLSRALAGSFESVVGVDFSASMLEEARRANAAFANLRFVQNDGRALGDVASASIDLVYSMIALQHVPAAWQRDVIREFGRVVAPGGAVVFQTPARHRFSSLSGLALGLVGNRLLNLPRRLVHGAGRVMEVHALPRAKVVSLLEESGLVVHDVERHDVAGPAFESYRYWATKA